MSVAEEFDCDAHADPGDGSSCRCTRLRNHTGKHHAMDSLGRGFLFDEETTMEEVKADNSPVTSPVTMEPLDAVQSKTQQRIAALEQSAQVLTAQLGRARFNYLVQKKQFEAEEARIMLELEKHGHAIAELRGAS